MPKRSSLVICALVALIALDRRACLPEEGSGPVVCRYKISSHGVNVGDLKTVMTPTVHKGDHAVRFASDLAVDANLIFYKKSSRSHEDAVVSERGTQSYHRKGEENGKNYCVDATLEGGAFRFTLNESGASCNVAVPKESYDYTTMDCPETRMRHEGESMEVRLLDMQRAAVVTRRFRFVKMEDVEVGGRTIRCKVVEFSDPKNNCRRWVSSDGHGLVIVRQEGKGEGGSYTLRLVSLKSS